MRRRAADGPLVYTGERIITPTIVHAPLAAVARYQWAAMRLPLVPLVLEAGCGCGFGASILSARALHVEAVDVSPSAIDYAREHYAQGGAIDWTVRDLADMQTWDGTRYNAIVAMQLLEHIDRVDHLLQLFAMALHPAGVLLGAVANEARDPYRSPSHPWHFRHFEQAELARLLRSAGFIPSTFFLQDESPPAPRPYSAEDPAGRLLLFMAVKP